MKFETPIVEVKKFDVEDILTTSGDPVVCDMDFCNGDCPVEGVLD